jgi:hypothetical protein
MKLTHRHIRSIIRVSMTTDMDLVVGEMLVDDNDNKYIATGKNTIVAEIHTESFIIPPLPKRFIRLTPNEDGSHEIIEIEP